jgi:peptidoglycan hydrolase-like protein with peptidoglycan-binding domain
MNPLMLGAYGLIGWGVFKLFKKSPVSTQATVVSPVVRPAPVAVSTSSGNASIAAIQSRLNALGANPPLAVDGISGPKTLAAIKVFQSANGIIPDGIVGPITQAALDTGGQVISPPVTQSTYVQPIPIQPIPIQAITADPSVSTNIHDVTTWADEPEQTLTFRNQ